MKPIPSRGLWKAAEPAGPGEDVPRIVDLQHVLDSIPHMVWASMPGEDRQEYYNIQWFEFTGVELDPDGSTRRGLIHPDDRERAVAAWDRCRASGEPYEHGYRLRHRSGEYRWILSRGRPERNHKGEVVCWYGSCTDMHEHALAREALAASEALTRNIIRASADALQLIDGQGKILFANDAAVRELGSDEASGIVGASWLDRVPASSRPLAQAAVGTALAGETARFTTIRSLSDGAIRWHNIIVTPVIEPGGQIRSLLVNSRDVTEERAAEERLRWTANHDALTQLPNRGHFHDCLVEAIRQADRESRPLGLLIVDVDELKQLNDGLGHAAGDALLCVFAERMKACVGSRDVVGRLGGDEFGLILTDVEKGEDIARAADRIIERLREPFTFEGRLLDCRGSLGASLFPEQGRDHTALMKHADLALYAAKAAGGMRWTLFRPEMRAEMQTRASMLSLARDAVREEQILAFYQPKIDLRSGAVAGFEALMRWRDSAGRLHLPGTIALAFGDNEIAPAITEAVVRHVVGDVRGWLDEGIPFGHVALNAAAADFRVAGFAERLLETLSRAGIPTGAIQLEVTETVFLGRGAECVETALRGLCEAGVRIALDDFGTGYASLSHLKRFPVDVLKIDRSFVRDLETDPDDAAIIRGVINLAKSLDIEVVAEGVENGEQERFLIENGCDFAQGFFYAKAVEAARVPDLARSGSPKRRRPALSAG